MGEQVEPDSGELAKLRAELRSCRLELAERHRELEALHEERHEILRRCEAAEEQVRAISASVDQPPEESQSERPTPGRLLRRKARK